MNEMRKIVINVKEQDTIFSTAFVFPVALPAYKW
jgi:hypothetical protein